MTKNTYQPQVPKKKTISSTPESFDDKHPVWAFFRCDRHKWFIGDDFAALINKIHDFETMTWREIKQDKKNNHYITFDTWSKEAQNRIDELKIDDYEQIFSLDLED
jgi:hypothetical protein